MTEKKGVELDPDDPLYDPPNVVRFDAKRKQKSSGQRAQLRGWQKFYIRVPWPWVDRLQSTKRPGAYRLALLVLYEHWKGRGQPINLSNILSAEVGLFPRSKWNALAELEQLGLIEVRRRPPKSPQVIARHVGHKAKS